MAADASERKALRYKQTLVSVPLCFSVLSVLHSLCLYLCVCVSVNISHALLLLCVMCQRRVGLNHSVTLVHDAPVPQKRADDNRNVCVRVHV